MASNMTVTSGELKDLGNVISLREETDPNYRVTKYIRANLAVVDIIPCDYTLNLSVLNNTGQYAISYDFSSGVDKYKKICGVYGLDNSYWGLRLWLTDDTQAYEEYSHHFDNNVIETAINTLSGRGRELRQILQSYGNNTVEHVYDKYLKDIGNSPMAKSITSTVGSIMQDAGFDKEMVAQLGNAVSGAASTAAQIIFQGKQLSLPRIWKGSSYAPSVTFNVKLVSPYGCKQAIKNFIIEPLIYILSLTAPRSNDGLSYGLYTPVRIKGYGVCNINLGAIQSVSIRRGGRETAYNVWKQPLIVDVALNVMPLCEGFAAMESSGMDVATISDATTEYTDTYYNAGCPAITTIGNVIQSLRPAPSEVVNSTFFSVSSSGQVFNTDSSIASSGNTEGSSSGGAIDAGTLASALK